MFADTLMQLERAYLVGLMLWGMASVIAGTSMVAALLAGRTRSPLLSHFGFQTMLWGAATLAAGAVRWHAIRMRDLADATRLDRYLWFGAGLDVGVMAVGIVLAGAALRFGRRPGPLGAGIAVVVQGAALLAMHTRLIGQLRG